MKKQRHEPRDLCADLIQIRWKDSSGQAVRQWSTLEDISSSGACLQVEQPIPTETVISIEFPDNECSARVKYCVFEHTGYFLGIKFENGYRWSRTKYKPEHLLQFRLRSARKY